MKLLIAILFPIVLFGALLSGLTPSENLLDEAEPTPQTAVDVGNDPGNTEEALQLRSLKSKTAPPTPTSVAFVPSPTPSCQNQKLAINMLLDTSNSMGGDISPTKLDDLKTAVIFFGGLLQNQDIIGVQDFSSIEATTSKTQPAREIYPIGPYNQASFNQAINSLTAEGYTHMRDGFLFSRQIIAAAKLSYTNYYWAFIFVTDGVPNDANIPGDLDYAQDPSDVRTAMIAANEITRLFTIGLDLDNPDFNIQNFARPLLLYLATSPSDFIDTPDPALLTQAYQKIAQRICR